MEQQFIIMAADRWAFYAGRDASNQPIWAASGAVPFFDFKQARRAARRIGGGARVCASFKPHQEKTA